ncbi:hypothetical protein [Paenibacillus sp. OAS669]|uniref:hypothetical protein n=1 Tax=Paenibacillus sp. OAS669 TaxID=2663821 RepID=UPI00178AF972|nr:hypothetical protein [Paenibacillus sp. OAS669]MBE1445236.1 hypothetical protein [Paenibacillus sp. OAS669]
MNKFHTFEDAEGLADKGISAIMDGSMVSDEAKLFMSPEDTISNHARIRIYTEDGRGHSDHYVLECRSHIGTTGTYLLCILIGNGTSFMNYSADDMLSFRDECDANDIAFQRDQPVLCYSYRGIAVVGQETVAAAF